MIISLKTIEFLIVTITYVLSYILAVSLVGYNNAWISDKMGDSTAKDLGYLTLNPAMHVEFIGMFFLLFFHFGWSPNVPKNPYNIRGKFQRLRQCVAFFSDVFVHLILALVGLLLVLCFFDDKILAIAYYIIASEDVSHLYVARMYADYAPSIVALGFFGIVFVYLNVFLGIIRLILDGWKFFMLSGIVRPTHYNHPTAIIFPILFMLFFYAKIKLFVLGMITDIGYMMARLIGLI